MTLTREMVEILTAHSPLPWMALEEPGDDSVGVADIPPSLWDDEGEHIFDIEPIEPSPAQVSAWNELPDDSDEEWDIRPTPREGAMMSWYDAEERFRMAVAEAIAEMMNAYADDTITIPVNARIQITLVDEDES